MTREERENALHCLKVMVGEEVCEECKLYGTTGTDHCEADCVRAAIEALKQEPRKGQWCPQNDDYFDWYECSECGYGSEGEMQYSSEYDVRTNFCPNCGADMREGKE